MSKYIFRLMFLLMLPVILTAVGAAQDKPGKKAAKAPARIELHLPVSVSDQKRHFVSDLTAGDFVVLENGRRHKITAFTDGKNSPPVYYGVLMDTSATMKGKLDFIREAVKTFTYSVVRSRKNKAAFLTFDRNITLLQDFTDKPDLLDSAIDKAKETGGPNTLYDAVWQFCDEKLRNAAGQRVIVAVTNGQDTAGRVKLEEAIYIAQRTETVIFVVSTRSGFLKSVPKDQAVTLKDADDKSMERLATETGGTIFFAGDMIDLDRAMTKILLENQARYTITYRSKNYKHPGKARKIEVRFADEKKMNGYAIRTVNRK